MKKLIVALLIGLFCIVPVKAQTDPNKDVIKELTTSNFGFSFAGSNEVFKFGLLFKPTERITIGPEFGYFDGMSLKEDGTKAYADPTYSLEMVARYFITKDIEADLYLFKVPVSTYVGLGIGAEWNNTTQRVDDIADLRSGTIFGDGNVRLGFEYEFVMNDLMWGGLNNATHKVLGQIWWFLK